MRRFQSFRLDTVNQCLWHGEARAELTPKAFGVLRYLVEHSGRLVTQEELLEALWPATYINPEVLRKYVLEIRRVLGDRPEKPTYIETRPKRGYQFVACVVDEIPTEMLPAGGTKKIVGREPALSDLGGCLVRTQRGERQILFITGEPGIGKTALIDEFQRHARADASGICIVRGQCVEGYGGKEPYYPVLEAVAELCRISGGDFVQTLERQAPTWLVQFPALLKNQRRQTLQREVAGASSQHMLREISEAIETIASEKPVLLILEDLHWADHSTVDLISAMARRRLPAKLMLIGTYRPVDLVLSAHPLRPLKQDLLIHHLCREIALQPLEEADVAEYVAAELGGPALPEGLTGLIYQRSEGSPLFMVAVLQHMREQRLITQDGSKVILTLPLQEIVDLCAPESLRQMIEIQLDRLSSEERRALEAASVTGVLFSAAISAAAANVDVNSFEDLCQGLSCRHQIVRSADTQEFPDGTVSDRFEFVHALYRDVLYRRQPRGRRAQLHLLIGERLEALYAHRLSDAASELAHHFEQGRDWSRAIKYLQLAADTAGRHSTQALASSLASGGANGGFSPLYQIGGPRAIQLALKLQF